MTIAADALAVIWPLIGSAFTILLGANAYFIKRLIDRIDHTAELASSAASKAATFERSIEGFVKEIKGIRKDLKEIHELDKQLSKLEAQLQLLLAKDGYFSGHGD